MLFVYGLRAGAALAARGRLREAAPLLIRPVNYWRVVEYREVLRELNATRDDRILDIGSPKLLAVYLADTVGAEVFATDLHERPLRRAVAIASARGLNSRLRMEVQDGRMLSYPHGWFTRVFSVSVLEHIPERGDIACAAEIGRVLAPGGRAVLTVPFSPSGGEEYRQRSYYWTEPAGNGASSGAFYQRRYSASDLRVRIIEPSGLRLCSVRYIGERFPAPPGRELNDYLPAISGPLHPLLSRVFHTPAVEDWRQLRRPLCAVIVLQRAPLADQ
jgi:SAM-dependent methyltransferase